MESIPENNVVGGDPTQNTGQQLPLENSQQQSDQQQQINLINLPIKTETDALNLMAGFLQVAQRRGVYTLAEAAKIMEAINRFGKTSDQPQQSQ